MPKNISSSYGGRVEGKMPVLRNYKFALCYENGRDIDGYITEKVFDCFFAGTIPIYWGANNISQYVPINCYIDRTKFKNDEDLYNFLKKMESSEIVKMQQNIESFLKSNRVLPFGNEFFAKNITETILNE
jgi:tRNA C32,U32 (ribose-2'-O)-methylase TrmJ